jgi:phage terminase large subunit GpA-like protein
MTWCESTSGAWAALEAAARVRPLRTLREFVEQEIILPTGPFEGQLFRVDRHPVVGLLLDELAKWRRSAVTGPGQDGKSLCSFVVPILYHLFEVGEDVICGVPNVEMAADKWRDDILPAIEASRFKDLLPKRGAGSKGGKVVAVKFRNGRVLRFMSGGGRDKSKAGKTSRVVVITETDGMDSPAGGSKEADPIRQIEARTKAFGANSKAYLECTVSTEDGRIWKEYQGGTASRVEVPCPHCAAWIRWEREHLVGWQDAKSVLEAAEKARLVCPSCGGLCDEDQKVAAVRRARLVHTRTDTDTLGFRWNAAISLLKPLAEIAKDEWKAAQSDDELANRALDQFTWAKPVKPEKVNLSETDWTKLAARQAHSKRGLVPADALFLTAGMDIQDETGNWSLVAWRADSSPHVVDYGILDLPSKSLGRARAIEVTINSFADRIVYPDMSGRSVRRAIVDAGNWQADVIAACRAMWPRIMPAKGFGEKQVRADRDIVQTGFEGARLDTGDVIVELLADHWKSRLHDALKIPIDKPGAMTLFQVEKVREHLAFVKHLTAERETQEYIPGKGNRRRWEMVAQSRPNHWLDATAMAFAAYQIEKGIPASQPRQTSDTPPVPYGGNKRW